MAKTIKKKLRNGPVIEVDVAILKWREKRKKNPELVGKRARAMQAKQDRTNAVVKAATLDVTKKKWF